jgi:2-(1,2-epoxy-1,2-dihydrophenyl)acetyl-CoA isomerase
MQGMSSESAGRGEPEVTLHHDAAVAVVTIRRPHRGNALDPASVAAMCDIFDSLARDPGPTRAVILRSEGKHFCTGADLGARDPKGRASIGHMIRSLEAGPHRLIHLVWNCRLPVVVELTGRTSGMGLHLALCADVSVAAASATFAEPFTDRGFNVDSGGSWLLTRFIGLSRATELLAYAQAIDAPTALDWGLINHVVDDSAVSDRVSTIASDLAQRPTFVFGVTKQLLRRGLSRGLDETLREEASMIELTIRSDDFKEGMRAFADRRPPEFTGH